MSADREAPRLVEILCGEDAYRIEVWQDRRVAWLEGPNEFKDEGMHDAQAMCSSGRNFAIDFKEMFHRYVVDALVRGGAENLEGRPIDDQCTRVIRLALKGLEAEQAEKLAAAA